MDKFEKKTHLHFLFSVVIGKYIGTSIKYSIAWINILASLIQ
jgi:hypothetical protein